jgi:hypothetical protein
VHCGIGRDGQLPEGRCGGVREDSCRAAGEQGCNVAGHGSACSRQAVDPSMQPLELTAGHHPGDRAVAEGGRPELCAADDAVLNRCDCGYPRITSAGNDHRSTRPHDRDDVCPLLVDLRPLEHTPLGIGRGLCAGGRFLSVRIAHTPKGGAARRREQAIENELRTSRNRPVTNAPSPSRPVNQ